MSSALPPDHRPALSTSVAVLPSPRAGVVPARRPVAVTVAAVVNLAGGVFVLGGIGYLLPLILWGGAETMTLAAPIVAAGVFMVMVGRGLLAGRSWTAAIGIASLLIITSMLCWAHFLDARWSIGMAFCAAVFALLTLPSSRAWCAHPDRSRAVGGRPGPSDSTNDGIQVTVAAIIMGTSAIGLIDTWRVSVTPTVQFWVAMAPFLLMPVLLISGALRLLQRGAAGLLILTTVVSTAVYAGLLSHQWEIRDARSVWSDMVVPVTIQIVAPVVALSLLAYGTRRSAHRAQLTVDTRPTAGDAGPTPPGTVIGAAVLAFSFGAKFVLLVVLEPTALGLLDAGTWTDFLARLVLAAGLTGGGVLLLVRHDPRLMVGSAIGSVVLPLIPLGAAVTSASLVGLIVPGLILALLLAPANRTWWHPARQVARAPHAEPVISRSH